MDIIWAYAPSGKKLSKEEIFKAIHYDTLKYGGNCYTQVYLDSIVEDYCSGKFFANQFQENGYDMFARAQHGDKEALEAFRQYGHHLGKAIQMILFSVDPEAIILGGSIAGSREIFEASMQETLQEFPYKHMIDKLKIVQATNKDAGVIGAASLCFSGY